MSKVTEYDVPGTVVKVWAIAPSSPELLLLNSISLVPLVVGITEFTFTVSGPPVHVHAVKPDSNEPLAKLVTVGGGFE